MSQSLRFISTAIRSGYYKQLFSSRETISSLVQGVVIPNVSLREHDIEQFEDDPLEFIRLDLALSSTGTDLATRRHSAADVLQALVSSGYESEATEIVGTWINTGLAEYGNNKAENWRAKDSAIYLLTAVATRGSTSQVNRSQVRGMLLCLTTFVTFSARSHVHECLGRRCPVLFCPYPPGSSGQHRISPPYSTSRRYPLLVHVPQPGLY